MTDITFLKRNVIATAICLAATLLTACDKKSNSLAEDPVEYESFRIEGMPTTRSIYQVQVYPGGTVITSIDEHVQAFPQCVAAGMIAETYGYSCDLLTYPAYASFWKGNGVFVVLVLINGEAESKALVADVSFTNGSATVKYGNFKPGYTVPL